MAIQFRSSNSTLLNSIFRSIFHKRETQTKTPTPPPVHLSEPEFPESAHNVSCYHDALQSPAYISNPKVVNSYKVVELVRFKTVAWSGVKQQQHQQVVAKVEIGEPGVYGYVCFERARQTRLTYNTLRHLVSNSSSASDTVDIFLDSLIEDGMPIGEAGTILHMKRRADSMPQTDENTLLVDDDSSQRNASTRHDASSSESSVSSTRWSSACHSDADDTISCISRYPSGMGVKRLESLQPAHLRLCDLAILVAAVHDLNPVYSIFYAQRLWFANLIMRIVERDDDHDTLVVQQQAQALPVLDDNNRYKSSRDEVCSGVGRWYKLRVDKTLLVVVEMARFQYLERRRRFDKRVCNSLLFYILRFFGFMLTFQIRRVIREAQICPGTTTGI